MKKLLLLSLFLFVCLLYAPSLMGVQAALLRFDKTSNSVAPGATFDVQVVIDPGSEQVTSTDAWILYDKNLFSVVFVKDGGYFPSVINDTSTAGKVYVAGLVNDPTEFKTGVGTVATITFKANTAGSASLSYECNPSATETSKIIKNDINSTNIIDCSQNGTQSVTVSNAGGGTTPAATPTKVPTAVPGAPTATPTMTLTPTATLTPSPILVITQLPVTFASSSATPTALPQSGTLENLLGIAIPGILLFAVGGALKVLLHI